MANSVQPVVYLAPTQPVSLVVEEGAPRLSMVTGFAAGSAVPVGPAGGVLAGFYPSPSRVAQPAIALTDGASITLDASKGNTFAVTLGGSRTLASPTNALDGQRIIVQVTQDVTGSRTLAYGTAFAFSTSLPAPTLSTATGTTDMLGFVYRAAVSKWELLAFVSGFPSGA